MLSLRFPGKNVEETWQNGAIPHFYRQVKSEVPSVAYTKKQIEFGSYCGLRSAVSENDTPIGGSHPMLYFPIQITEKYSIVLCYLLSNSALLANLLSLLSFLHT